MNTTSTLTLAKPNLTHSKPCHGRISILDIAAFGCGQDHSYSPACDKENPRIWSKHHFQHSWDWAPTWGQRPPQSLGASERENVPHHDPETLEWTGSGWQWASSPKKKTP